VLDVPGLAAVLAGAEVAVVNNSGGMHLADAVRTPLVVLFAGTERPGEYAPRSSRAVVLNRRTACSPCRQFRCPLDHACLDVAADQVAAAARALARTAVAA
jgi:ADP-heptose:LPS heptosyltransferase